MGSSPFLSAYMDNGQSYKPSNSNIMKKNCLSSFAFVHTLLCHSLSVLVFISYKLDQLYYKHYFSRSEQLGKYILPSACLPKSRDVYVQNDLG